MGAVLAVAATLSALLAPDAPSVAEVARAALGPAAQSAPEGSDELPGFEAVGVRSDTLAGRGARTVIYRRGATDIHVSIVDGRPLELPGSDRVTVGDVDLALDRDGDVNLVAWHADGRTRILASRDASAEEMVDLIRRA